MIFGGYGRKAKQRGEVYFVCLECDRLNVFGLLENYGYAQVYGIRLAKYGSERFMACSHCQRGWELDKEQWRHALRVAEVLRAQPQLTPRQLAQSAIVLAEGALPDLAPVVRELLARDLAGGMDPIFDVLPEAPMPDGLDPGLAALMSGGKLPSAKASRKEPDRSEGSAEPESEVSKPASAPQNEKGGQEPAMPDPSSVDANEEPSDEELEAKRRALRYKLIEGFEALDWDVQLQSGEIILGNGRARVQPLLFDRVLIYVPIIEPTFTEPEVNDLNADMPFACFIAKYALSGGGDAWGGFLRISLPEGDLSASETARWVEAQVFDVLGATRAFDAAEVD